MKAENYLFLSAFKQLLDTQPELFKDSERTELEGLITSLASDTEQLVDDIARWCASHSEINNALMPLIDEKATVEKGIGGTLPTPEAKAEYKKNSSEELLNALRKSSPPETQKPNTPKG
ncbi:MAG: hypothetical protein F6J90_35035 [Moorea sp. SIOASIH]|uniref:hypothetical protein n=1 Tax=Moorena sp. SIOASIH TaxID=2607817 RepID=UPI0013BA5F46|nr:hypothetical protein [Moorena sp. SIOASIH]NEO41264.1 hypothetical protein [Moorena sp. SIOASIH]